MLALMNQKRCEKNAGMTIHLVDRFPALSELDALTFLGSFSWTAPSIKTRWVLKQFAYNLGGGVVTPSDIARDYIAIKFGDKRLRCNSKQWLEVVKKKKHAPLYAVPCTLTNAFYLDMKSAYWQLLMLGGFDVDYMPKRYLSPRSDVYDFPVPSLKLARNCLVSLGLPSGANVWIPNHGFERKKATRANPNLILWGFVQDVLHGFASDMLSCAGAVYVNTDGYIIPSDRMPDAEAVSDSWGLTVGIKEMGKAVIRGAGDYDIGSHTSGRQRTVPRAYKYIVPREVDWLRQKVKFWSKRVNLQMSDIVPLYKS